MAVSQERVARLERELEEARRELTREDGERYRILMRELSEDDRARILENLTDKKERVLFGLDAPEEEKGKTRPGASGGDLTCKICGKTGLTKRGLGLHMIRIHKDETEKERAQAA